jgi:hypothetical protein
LGQAAERRAVEVEAGLAAEVVQAAGREAEQVVEEAEDQAVGQVAVVDRLRLRWVVRDINPGCNFHRSRRFRFLREG